MKNPSHLDLAPQTSVPPKSTRVVDWRMRLEEQREREWAAHECLIVCAMELIERWKDEAKPPTLETIIKLFDASSKLGRLATEQAAAAPPEPQQPELPDEFNVAMEKVFGSGQAQALSGDTRAAEEGATP